MLNIPEEYKVDLDTKVPYQVKKKEEGKTVYYIKCSFCNHPIKVMHGQKRESIKTCPYCKNFSPWLLKPKTERILFELQDKFYRSIDEDLFRSFSEEIKKEEYEQDEEIINSHKIQLEKNQELLTQMFFIIKDYSNSLLKRRIKSKGFYLKPNDFEEKVEQITFLWYKQFMEKPDVRVHTSWAGHLEWKITEALYLNQEDETMDSFDRVIEHSGDKEQTLEDLAETFNIKFLFRPSGEVIGNPYNTTIEISKELRKLILLVLKTIKKDGKKSSHREAILSLYSLLFFLQKDSKREDFLYSTFGNNIRSNGEKIKMILRKYLRDIQQQV